MNEPSSSGPTRLTGFAVGVSLFAAAGLALHLLIPDPEEAATRPELPPPPPGPAPEVPGPWRVIVLPFATSGAEAPDTGGAIAEALGAQLDRGAEVTASRVEAPAHEGAPTWQDGFAASWPAEATHFVLGALEPAPGGLRVRAALHHHLGAVVREAQVTAPRDEVARRLADLARELLADRGAEGESAESTTESLDALRAFVRGERAAAAGDDAEAEAAYADAVSADPGFVRASYRRADALERLGRLEAAAEALGATLRVRDRLAAADVTRAEALLAIWRGQYGRATALLEQHVRARPSDAEAWLRLGEVRLSLGPSSGRPPADARDAFEHVVALRRHDRCALEGLLVLAVDDGDLDATSRLLGALTDEDRPPYALALAIARGDGAAIEAAGSASPAPAVLLALPDLAGHAWLAGRGDGPEEAIAFAEHALAHGRPQAAIERLEPTWGAMSTFAVERTVALLLLPPFAVREADLSRLCPRATGPVAETPDAEDPHAAARPHVRRFLAGACAHRLGDAAEASAAIEALRAAADPVATMLAAELEAWVALDAGQLARVPTLLEGTRADLPAWRLERSPILSGALGRWVLAESHLRQRELAATLPVAQSLAYPAGATRALAAQSAWIVAEVYRLAGREAEMRRSYGRFLSYREDCEPVFEVDRDAARGHVPTPEETE